MIHIGDKVEITDTGKIYSMYPGFLDYLREISSSNLIERVCSQYEYGRSPSVEDTTRVFTVMFIREHGSLEGDILAIINDGSVSYIIDVNALTLVSSDLPFSEGDKVYITNIGHIYTGWLELVKNMSTTMPDGEKVYHKWLMGLRPTSEETNRQSPDSIFTVKWIGYHISRPNEDKIAIISNDSHTYIMSVKGLETAGEKKWDKYIIYVRNWAVINKETAQSVRDATGPKPYAEWLRDRR